MIRINYKFRIKNPQTRAGDRPAAGLRAPSVARRKRRNAGATAAGCDAARGWGGTRSRGHRGAAGTIA